MYVLQVFRYSKSFFEEHLELSWGPAEDENMRLIFVMIHVLLGRTHAIRMAPKVIR